MDAERFVELMAQQDYVTYSRGNDGIFTHSNIHIEYVTMKDGAIVIAGEEEERIEIDTEKDVEIEQSLEDNTVKVTQGEDVMIISYEDLGG